MGNCISKSDGHRGRNSGFHPFPVDNDTNAIPLTPLRSVYKAERPLIQAPFDDEMSPNRVVGLSIGGGSNSVATVPPPVYLPSGRLRDIPTEDNSPYANGQASTSASGSGGFLTSSNVGRRAHKGRSKLSSFAKIFDADDYDTPYYEAQEEIALLQSIATTGMSPPKKPLFSFPRSFTATNLGSSRSSNHLFPRSVTTGDINKPLPDIPDPDPLHAYMVRNRIHVDWAWDIWEKNDKKLADQQRDRISMKNKGKAKERSVPLPLPPPPPPPRSQKLSKCKSMPELAVVPFEDDLVNVPFINEKDFSICKTPSPKAGPSKEYIESIRAISSQGSPQGLQFRGPFTPRSPYGYGGPYGHGGPAGPSSPRHPRQPIPIRGGPHALPNPFGHDGTIDTNRRQRDPQGPQGSRSMSGMHRPANPSRRGGSHQRRGSRGIDRPGPRSHRRRFSRSGAFGGHHRRSSSSSSTAESGARRGRSSHKPTRLSVVLESRLSRLDIEGMLSGKGKATEEEEEEEEEVNPRHAMARSIIQTKVRELVGSEKEAAAITAVILSMDDAVIDACVRDRGGCEYICDKIREGKRGVLEEGDVMIEEEEEEEEESEESKVVALMEKFVIGDEEDEQEEDDGMYEGEGKGIAL